MKRAKTICTVLLIGFGGLMVAAFVMNNVAPSPVTAAKAHCVEQGWENSELSLSGFETSTKIAGGGLILYSSAAVRIRGKRQDQIKMIRVDLNKGAFSTKWQVAEYDETDAE